MRGRVQRNLLALLAFERAVENVSEERQEGFRHLLVGAFAKGEIAKRLARGLALMPHGVQDQAGHDVREVATRHVHGRDSGRPFGVGVGVLQFGGDGPATGQRGGMLNVLDGAHDGQAPLHETIARPLRSGA